MTKPTEYSEKNIERYAGLAGIRKKPAVYIGPTDDAGLWTIWREPADNTVDRALAGANSLSHLIVDTQPNTYWVVDAGDGIPVGKKEFADERGRKEKLSTLYVVTGLTHGGGNFSGDTISRGTHGIGIKATNALSTRFKVWTFRDGKWWAIEYAKGVVVKDVHVTTAPKLPHGIKTTKGTVTRFEPDMSIFTKGTKMNMKYVRDWCTLTSYLVPGLRVRFTNSKGETKELLSKRGALDYIDKRVAELKCETLGKVFSHTSKESDVAIAFTDADGADLIQAYTNGLYNSEGGEHVRALYDALLKSLKPYMGRLTFTAGALRDGMIGLVNYKISAPQFNNQPKDKLIDSRVYASAQAELLTAFTAFWTKNKGMAKDVCVRAANLHEATVDFKANKKAMRSLKTTRSKILLPGKLHGSPDCKPHERELFLVEGDSAGGTTKLARDKHFQEVFCLKGKILNALRATQTQVLSSEEIVGILQAVGFDPNKSNPMDHLRVGRIITLADPDPDGDHIDTLLFTLLWSYTPEVFRRGMVYMVAVAEFTATVNNRRIYANSLEELAHKNGGVAPKNVLHIKGYGEVSPTVLREMAFDKSTRRLYRVGPPADKARGKEFRLIMEDDPAYRKKMLGV